MTGSHQATADGVNDFVEDIVVVQETGGMVYFLLISYTPGSSGNASGYVFRRPVGSDEQAENILATNDTLRQLWCSPNGHVWATSSTGLVWTTAPVAWSSELPADLEFETPQGDLTWHHVALPSQQHNGARPNPMSIWGVSDDDVHIGTFGGVLYHWNGRDWSQCYPGIGKPIGALRGRATDDVYAAGYGSTLLHFDGRQWTRIVDPDGPDMEDLLSGITFGDAGDVYICGKSRGGRVLRGSATQGFSVLGRYDAPLIDIARVDGRVFLAATKQGVLELTPEGAVALRDDIIPWSIVEGEGRVYVTETPGEAAYSELDLTSGEWRRRHY